MSRKKNASDNPAPEEIPVAQPVTPEAEAAVTATPDTNSHQTNGTAEEKKRPCMKFGPYAVDKGNNVQVAVWDRQIKLPDGREITVYSATIQASYLDQPSGQWVNTAFFRGTALPIVCHALMKAFDWILEARNEARTQAPAQNDQGPIPF